MTLRQHDLKDMIYHILEIDSYKSKMGSDEEIVTVALSAKTKESANDMVNFFEKGYSFILDADATSGEQSDGTYKVFVEIERSKDIADQIVELANGLENLTGLKDVKFRYYKNFQSLPLEKTTLEATIPLDRDSYNSIVTETNLSNYKNFFNRSFVEDVSMLDDLLTIKKAYADPVYFRFINFGDTVETLEAITESFNANDFAEIIFLSKYVGDYNITKYGNKLTFENEGSTLVVERIVT
jgi:hypothetical protein